jgi:hypothetical protein
MLINVRNQVGQNLYAASIPFAVAVNDGKDAVKIIDNYNCKKLEQTHVVVIADIVSTILLLSKPGHNYILMFDEPTIHLDMVDSFMVDYLSNIFKRMPRVTILSTATPPNKDDVPMLETAFMMKYPSSKVVYVKSNDVRIGAELSTYDGVLYTPHMMCKSGSDVQHILHKLADNVALQKYYTLNIVIQMYEQLQRLNIYSGVPNVYHYVNTPEYMNQQAIQNLALIYLRSVMCCSDDVVSAFCSVLHKSVNIEFSKLHMLSKSVLNSQTLIATDDPITFMTTHFGECIQSVYKSLHVKDFEQLYSSYVKDLAAYSKRVEKYIKDTAREDTANSGSNPEVRPSLGGMFSKYILSEHESTIISAINSIPFGDMDCPDILKVGLCIGIGIYQPSKVGCSYTDTVINLVNSKALAYFISDGNGCYGNNYPIENLIIDDSPELMSRSIQTMYQLCARVGRPGKSWKANVYIPPQLLIRLGDSITSKSSADDIETINFNKALRFAIGGGI